MFDGTAPSPHPPPISRATWWDGAPLEGGACVRWEVEVVEEASGGEEGGRWWGRGRGCVEEEGARWDGGGG